MPAIQIENPGGAFGLPATVPVHGAVYGEFLQDSTSPITGTTAGRNLVSFSSSNPPNVKQWQTTDNLVQWAGIAIELVASQTSTGTSVDVLVNGVVDSVLISSSGAVSQYDLLAGSTLTNGSVCTFASTGGALPY